jgi:hypothetical protein
MRASAHEVNNLYSIVFFQQSRGPISAAYHFLIDFDCDSFRGQVELCD